MILPASTAANSLAADSRGLDALKRTARESPEKALKAAATQFEALFMNMVLKNMRDSLPKDGLLSSSAGDTYTGMLDQQLSQKLAGQGTGLADMLVKQLSRNMKPAATDATVAKATGEAATTAGLSAATPGTTANSTAVTGKAMAITNRGLRLSTAPGAATNPGIAAGTVKPAAPSTLRMRLSANMAESAVGPARLPAAASPTGDVASAKIALARAGSTRAGINELKRDFVARVSLHAQDAEQKTGVPARFMIGQAALESGWGRHEIKDAKGQSAFNLFGIKATGSWTGPTVDVTTTEFVNGIARKVVEKFRAYASYAEGFADYAKVIADNPRYANVLKTAQDGIDSFARGLQRAGYATDPAYAVKLASVIKDAIKIDRLA